MTTERLHVRLLPDGGVEVRTEGMNREACIALIPKLEEMFDARAVDSRFESQSPVTSRVREVQTARQQSKIKADR